MVFLHQSGGPSQMDLFDYKPTLEKFAGTELPDSVRMGQRITGMTSGQTSLPGGALHLQVSAARTIRRVGQRTAAAHRQDRRRSHHRQDDEHRRHQSRSGDHVHPKRQPAAGPPEHGRVGQLRPRQREQESACVRRDALAGAGAESRPAAVFAPVGQRLSAIQSSGRALPRGQQSGALPAQSGRHRPRARAATCWTPRAN